MFCSSCGAQIEDHVRFCPECGTLTAKAAGSTAAQPKIQGQKVTENIYLCPDGIYRWIYEFAMLKNPTVLFTIWKIFGGIIGGVWLFLQLIALFEGGLNADSFIGSTGLFAVIAAGMLVLSFLAYLIVAALYGWKYIVLFEMNESGITHTQMQQQFKKAQALGWLTAMAGSLTGNPAMAGAGISSAVHDSIHSDFDKVKSIKVRRSRHTIYVNEMLFKNQVYAAADDFDFVLNYINERISKDAARK
ncbi:MAG: zinc ribbon domain-containing protein [Ruminiclostridium sp.]|nr:zinc ribbon domain-containing protein [Ruminiclostridium sp.]